MRRVDFIGIASVFALLQAPALAADIEAHIRNPIAIDRPDSLIHIKLSSLLQSNNAPPVAWDAKAAGMPVPAQVMGDELLLLLNLAPNQERVVKIRPLPDGPAPRVIPRTQADMAVRVNGTPEPKDGHTVYKGGEIKNVETASFAMHWEHDGLMLHEGPGWESDRVAYRLYLDHRAVTDLFAKKRPELVMHNVGRESSYHVMADWGMDILEVGESLGDGSIGVLRDNKATQIGPFAKITADQVANGPILAGYEVTTKDWDFAGKKQDLTARYVIAAGSRLTEITGKTAAGLPMVAGIVKHKDVAILTPSDPKGRAWAYIGSWGHQSLADKSDLLGLAFFYPVADVRETGDDGNSLYALYADSKKPIHAYAGAAWPQELGGIANEEQFRHWLEDTAESLSHPLEVTLTGN